MLGKDRMKSGSQRVMAAVEVEKNVVSSLLTCQRIIQHQQDISRISWPAQSPDINSTENIRKVLKKPSSVRNFQHWNSQRPTACVYCWHGLHSVYIRQLRVNSVTQIYVASATSIHRLMLPLPLCSASSLGTSYPMNSQPAIRPDKRQTSATSQQHRKQAGQYKT